tara:strand:+ start:755 stop:2155 length:1401 start_codon:yes stop_codon:yes gene_type:complete
MKINHTYIINLNSTSEEIENKAQHFNFPIEIPYYNMPAINGWEAVKDKTISPFEFKVADWWSSKEYGDNFWYNRDVTPGEVGCMLSHYKCIYHAHQNGFENILILEEDFKTINAFPTEEILEEVPDDCSILYLDRNKHPDSKGELRITQNVTKIGYSYNTHAYIVTKKGMNEVLNSTILDNIIASDEFYSAINGTSTRTDAIKNLHDPKFRAYALNGGYFNQTSNTDENSLTESPPKATVHHNLETNSIIPDYIQDQIPTIENHSILNDDNWEEWCKKYINPLILNKQYDLIIDEPTYHVYTFPFFTKEFCKELIELGESKEWVNNRHEFYPTTDNLLEVLGMDVIYNRIINEHIQPLAKHVYQLEGTTWDGLRDESFIVRYKPEEQAHLGLHHDSSNITTLVNLNVGEFKGGGTYFNKTKTLINPNESGIMTLHPGNITHKHGARPVTEGTRYVVVSFIKSQNHN